MTKISGQFLISGISGISGQLGALLQYWNQGILNPDGTPEWCHLSTPLSVCVYPDSVNALDQLVRRMFSSSGSGWRL